MVMLKSSWYDDFTIGNHLWKTHLTWTIQNDNRQLMIMCSVLISYCVCRRPSWTPKTKPNDSSALLFGWIFGVQLDSLENKCPIWQSKPCRWLISTCVCRRPSWTPKTQPNGAVRRRFVEFLVFNSICPLKCVPSDVEIGCKTFPASGGTLFNWWIELNTKNSTKQRLTRFLPLDGTLIF